MGSNRFLSIQAQDFIEEQVNVPVTGRVVYS